MRQPDFSLLAAVSLPLHQGKGTPLCGATAGSQHRDQACPGEEASSVSVHSFISTGPGPGYETKVLHQH